MCRLKIGFHSPQGPTRPHGPGPGARDVREGYFVRVGAGVFEPPHPPSQIQVSIFAQLCHYFCSQNFESAHFFRYQFL